MKIRRYIITALASLIALPALADSNGKNQFNPVQTGVTSLGIAPDARGAAMGDLGVATEPDAYSQYWNPSKYAFAYSSAAVSLSYTPWLRKLVNDIFLANLSGYWKMGSGDNQAVSASLRYFSLGEIQMSESFSMGVALRYIYSDLAFSDAYSAEQQKGASAFAADISGFLTTYPVVGRNECQWSWGFNISNIGSKVSYNDGNDPAFLPTNFRLGTTFTFPVAQYNNIALSLDANKLLVPTRPRQSDFTDAEGNYDQEAYESKLEDWRNTSSISGIFKSFSDAPGGFKEELKEITLSVGAEYNYNQQFFVRTGYFYENAMKGNRQYFSFGAGFSLNVVQLDAAYMIATAQNSPLDQTLRFSLTFDMDGLKHLLGKK